eukprot:CAMPEP_0115830682 /NCGR_PEP_ID=MMETSP0287-20121206/1742_1 /TAXON_ID=412157 /ORGANISM="Chrysochromulina rotalis, Strain UIO044" /LENGTH=77 /DNA_ID=CAMNT_0003283991 /DNA_START=70 /DNA_END=303 /DNA_ORIENTATION=+
MCHVFQEQTSAAGCICRTRTASSVGTSLTSTLASGSLLAPLDTPSLPSGTPSVAGAPEIGGAEFPAPSPPSSADKAE